MTVWFIYRFFFFLLAAACCAAKVNVFDAAASDFMPPMMGIFCIIVGG